MCYEKENVKRKTKGNVFRIVGYIFLKEGDSEKQTTVHSYREWHLAYSVYSGGVNFPRSYVKLLESFVQIKSITILKYNNLSYYQI